MVIIMPYEELVIQVMDKIVRLANSQVSRKMWYKVRNVCPENPKYCDRRRGTRGGYHRYHPVLVTVVVHILRELGFKVVKRKNMGRTKCWYYFLIDLDDLTS